MLIPSERYFRYGREKYYPGHHDEDLLNRHEYLSGMKRTGRFPAVITVVVYYGLDPWDGPVTLRDMLDIPQEYTPFVQDCSMQLVEVRCCHLKLHNQNNIHLFDMLRFALNQDLTWQQARNQVLEYADAHHPEKIILMTLSSIIDRKIDFSCYEKRRILL